MMVMTNDNIIRKSQTGQAGNGGEFGTHARPDGTTLTAVGVKAIDLTELLDDESGVTDVRAEDRESYLNTNKAEIAEWLQDEYGAELQVDGETLDDWKNARIIGGTTEMHEDADSRILVYNLIGHLEVDGVPAGADDAAAICETVGHNVVGDESPYCVRCTEELPELSTLDGAPDLDPAGHAPFYRALGGPEEQPAVTDLATLTNNDELIGLFHAGRTVGYSWRGEKIPARDLVERMIAARELSPAARDMPVADVLWQYTEANALDADDPDFPTAIAKEQLRNTDDLSWLAGEDDDR
jgi:hypothetical protein